MENQLQDYYVWTLRNFSKNQSQKLCSDVFEAGQYFWRLVMYPKGTATLANGLEAKTYQEYYSLNPRSQVALYLDQPDVQFLPQIAMPKASFKLILVNQVDLQQSSVRDSEHTFSLADSDWGFTQYKLLGEVLNPANGFLVDDVLVIKVQINILNYDSSIHQARQITQCVGIKNQGATCYMNSLLQSLFHLGAFRQAVYQMAANSEESTAPTIPFALQRLFYKLQHSHVSVSTKELTQSFGWTQADVSLYQQDVQELNRLLMEKLEEKMKGTEVEKAIPQLFQGHYVTYIRCINVDYQSSRRESFMDLNLDIKGCKNVYESLEQFTEAETLDGDNKFSTEDFGMQDAKKGILFEELPPILFLHLKRYFYDYNKNREIKLNDRFEFYDEIDFDFDNRKFFTDKSKSSESNNIYQLQSVFVHSGQMYSGHYYAYIQDEQSKWLKFDDEKVSIANKSSAIEEQYGGQDSNQNSSHNLSMVKGNISSMGGSSFTGGTNNSQVKNSGSSAYMLVYVRKSQWDQIMKSSHDENIQDFLKTSLKDEMKQKELRRKTILEAHKVVNFRVASNYDIKQQVGRDLQFDLLDHSQVPLHKIYRNQTLQELKDMIYKVNGISQDKQILWLCKRFPNYHYRPYKLLWGISDNLLIRQVHNEIQLSLKLESTSQSSNKYSSPLNTTSLLSNVQMLYYQRLASQNQFAYLLGNPVGGVGGSSQVVNFNQVMGPQGVGCDLQEQAKFEMANKSYVGCQTTFDLFVDVIQEDIEDDSMLIFVKYFDVDTNLLTYVDRGYFPRSNSLSWIINFLIQKYQFEGSYMDYLLFQEEYCEEDERLIMIHNPNLQLGEIDVDNGAIFILQKKLNGYRQTEDSEIIFKVEDFFKSLLTNVQVTFILLNKSMDRTNTLNLNKEDTYTVVVSKLAKVIGLQKPLRIRICLFDNSYHSSSTTIPRINVPFQQLQFYTLQDILEQQDFQIEDFKLYYEVLDIELPDLDQLKLVKVAFYLQSSQIYNIFQVGAPINGTVKDILESLRSYLPHEYGNVKLRMLKQSNYRITQFYSLGESIDDVLGSLRANEILRVEQIPDDDIVQETETQNRSLCGFVRFFKHPENGDTIKLFGEPFVMNIGQDETLGQINQRIFRRQIYLPDDLQKIQFYILANEQIFKMEDAYLNLSLTPDTNQDAIFQLQDNVKIFQLLNRVPQEMQKEIGIYSEEESNQMKRSYLKQSQDNLMRIN